MRVLRAAGRLLRGPFHLWHVPPGRETGASAVEYGLLIAGIAAVIALAVYLFGGGVLDLFQDTCDTVGSTAGAGTC